MQWSVVPLKVQVRGRGDLTGILGMGEGGFELRSYRKEAGIKKSGNKVTRKKI